MSASDHLNGEQLKMFMSPNEIDAAGFKPTEPYPLRKTREAKAWGLTDSIAQEGVRYPLTLGHSEAAHDEWGAETGGRKPYRAIVNGHHRYYGQRDVDPDRLMPVLHGEDVYDSLGSQESNDGSWAVEVRALREAPELPSQYTARSNYPAGKTYRTAGHSTGWDVGGMA